MPLRVLRLLCLHARMQLRARSAAQHPALDLLHPAFASLSAFEAAALAVLSNHVNMRAAAEAGKLVRMLLACRCTAISITCASCACLLCIAC